jgi:hypothetical protein
VKKLISISLVLLCAAVGGLALKTRNTLPPDPPAEDHGLSCKLSLPANPPDRYHQIHCALVVTNVSKGPITLCTMNGRMGDHIKEEITPEVFKSLGPSPGQLRASRKILQPGESVELPFLLFYAGKDETFKLTVSYRVSEKFAKEYEVWSGAISAGREVKITQEGVK